MIATIQSSDSHRRLKIVMDLNSLRYTRGLSLVEFVFNPHIFWIIDRSDQNGNPHLKNNLQLLIHLSGVAPSVARSSYFYRMVDIVDFSTCN